MNEEEIKETLKTMKENIDKKYLKTRNSEAIETILNLLEKKDIDIIETKEANRQLSVELKKKDKIINEMKKENHDLKEKLQMFIPRRRVRRVYKMLGKILSVDIDPIILEKELKAEYKIKEDK